MAFVVSLRVFSRTSVHPAEKEAYGAVGGIWKQMLQPSKPPGKRRSDDGEREINTLKPAQNQFHWDLIKVADPRLPLIHSLGVFFCFLLS